MGHKTGSDALRHSFSLRMSTGDEGLNSSSLVSSETNQHPLDRQSHAQELIHGRIEQARFRTICALHDSGDSALEKRAGRMGLCCVSPQILVGQGETPVCIAGYCRDRMCPTCMRRRAANVRRRLTDLVCSFNSPRFLTLTERDDNSGLASRMDHLSKCVRTLRRTEVWKRHVRGGVMVWEVKHNKAANTWHPHLHLIIDGEFFPHKLLHAEWTRILGRDGTTDLQAVNDRAKTARYMCGYLTKGSSVETWFDATIVEFATAMHRRRLVATFGTAHAKNLDLCDKEPERPALPGSVIGFAQLRDAIISGVEPARRAAPLLAMLGGAWRQLFIEFAPMDGSEVEALTDQHSIDLAAWIDELNGLLLRSEEPEPAPPPLDFRGQLDLSHNGDG